MTATHITFDVAAGVAVTVAAKIFPLGWQVPFWHFAPTTHTSAPAA